MNIRPTDDGHGPVLAALIALLGHHRSSDREDALMNAIVAVLEREVEAQQRVGAELTDEVEAQQRVGAGLTDSSARRYALRAIQNQLIDEWRRRRRDEKLQNQLIDEGRRRRRDEKIPRDLVVPDPLDDSQNEDSTALVVSALLEELAPNDRALLDAYFTSHDEYHAESQHQRLTATSARSRIYSLLKRLRRDGRRLRSPTARER